MRQRTLSDTDTHTHTRHKLHLYSRIHIVPGVYDYAGLDFKVLLYIIYVYVDIFTISKAKYDMSLSSDLYFLTHLDTSVIIYQLQLMFSTTFSESVSLLDTSGIDSINLKSIISA